jgi:pimeloyl-ACP methyl ester carboxylesterase
MPTLRQGDLVLYYDEFARGFPIITFAPKGLQSTITAWTGAGAPINPIREFSDRFCVIAMDQRNASPRSRAPITREDGWQTFTGDHIALLDHLEVRRCHLYGQGTGASFVLGLLRAQPHRVASAVLVQPIGRVSPELPPRTARFNAWADSIASEHPEASETVLDVFYRNLYAPGFVYSVHRNLVSTITTPCLVLAGNDEAHPMATSRDLAKLLPKCELISEWKAGHALAGARDRVREFFVKHTP